MAFLTADRVQETTATTGTGTLNLAGASTQFQTFIAGIGNGNQTFYCILSGDGTNWETGIGTVTAGTPNTLSRSVIASSNSNALVSLTGTSTVFADAPAQSLPSNWNAALTSSTVQTGNFNVFPTKLALPAFVEGGRVSINAVIKKASADNAFVGVVNGSGAGYSINWQSDNNFVSYSTTSTTQTVIHSSGAVTSVGSPGYFLFNFEIVPQAASPFNCLLCNLWNITGNGPQNSGAVSLLSGTWNAYAFSSAGFSNIQSFDVTFGAAK
jgi:hypothetical protein